MKWKFSTCMAIFFLLLAFISNSMNGAIPEQERTALIDLYNATNGDSWQNNTGWKYSPWYQDQFTEPGTESNWYGIVIERDHVTKIQLDNNNLTGSLPPTLGNLSKLYYLSLEGNQISGRIPPQLGNLRNLHYFSLRKNQFIGAIPHELGNLKNLKVFSLGHNQLGGRIPPQLGNLSQLKQLLLGHNLFVGGIPSQLGNLSYIDSIYLDNNQLAGSILPQLGDLSTLRVLDLSENRLSGIIPFELWRNKRLRNVYLHDNQLSGAFPFFGGPMPNLFHLYLDNNQLSGEIPPRLRLLNRIERLDIGYNCLHASDFALLAWLNTHNPGWWVHQDQCGGAQPQSAIRLNCAQLFFCALAPSLQTITAPQEVWITNSGAGKLNWSINTDASWFTCTPQSGTGNGIITVSVNPAGLSMGAYTGVIIITDPNAVNSPRYISVALKIKPDSEEMPPFGEFLTPVDGSNVCSSIPVTGWVLDDIGVQSVKIYREEGQTLDFIGNAVFVDSARPDIEIAYPGYPLSYKAGWGYMMLTNSLPNGGNGVFKFHAFAADVNGNLSDLGVTTITVDNAHAVKPFGYIDTPTQCGIASGKNFVNVGWALTPQPNYIPVDGSTIVVCVDGVKLGHPTYNLFREDIVAVFPGYTNSNGAVGKYYLDTTAFRNGIHTLYWDVSDNAGNIDGIGSRYFTIFNTNQGSNMAVLNDKRPGVSEETPGLLAGFRSVLLKKGYNEEINPREIYDDEEGFIQIQCRELERIEIILKDAPSAYFSGYMIVGEEPRPLPIGSILDAERGVFYWQPGPGFIGKYHLVFIEKEETGAINRKDIIVNITHRFPGTE